MLQQFYGRNKMQALPRQTIAIYPIKHTTFFSVEPIFQSNPLRPKNKTTPQPYDCKSVVSGAEETMSKTKAPIGYKIINVYYTIEFFIISTKKRGEIDTRFN